MSSSAQGACGKQVEDDEDDDILENKTQPSQAAPTPQMARQEQLSFKRERGEVLPLFMASHVGARARFDLVATRDVEDPWARTRICDEEGRVQLSQRPCEAKEVRAGAHASTRATPNPGEQYHSNHERKQALVRRLAFNGTMGADALNARKLFARLGCARFVLASSFLDLLGFSIAPNRK
eukprot:s508_g4.t2